MDAFDFNYSEENKKLLPIFFKAVQTSIPDFSHAEEWKQFAHAIALKFYRHITTLNLLSTPKFDPTSGDRYVDFASIKVVERAAFENVLVFSHLYEATNAELAKFRFNIWKVCGLMDRQRHIPHSEGYDRQIKEELNQIHKLWEEIKSSSLYDDYTSKQKARLEAGEWMGVNKWSTLAKQANTHFYYERMYKHTSGYGHTGYISALQIGQAKQLEIQKEMAAVSLGTALVMTTHFLSIFGTLSPLAAAVLAEAPDVKVLFAAWRITDPSWTDVLAKKNPS